MAYQRHGRTDGRLTIAIPRWAIYVHQAVKMMSHISVNSAFWPWPVMLDELRKRKTCSNCCTQITHESAKGLVYYSVGLLSDLWNSRSESVRPVSSYFWYLNIEAMSFTRESWSEIRKCQLGLVILGSISIESRRARPYTTSRNPYTVTSVRSCLCLHRCSTVGTTASALIQTVNVIRDWSVVCLRIACW